MTSTGERNINPVFTIGHSRLPYGRFVGLLADAGVTTVVDVRSMPYSRHFPHFSREALQAALHDDGIAYADMGVELGGRPAEPGLFRDGIADYERMAKAAPFIPALDRVVSGAARHRVALMCSEHEPLDCHRCLLVGRVLHARGVPVRHILSDGEQRTHLQIEDMLLSITGRAADDLFASRDERLALAYRERNRRVAFSADIPDSGVPDAGRPQLGLAGAAT